jgi:hypothetical protein
MGFSDGCDRLLSKCCSNDPESSELGNKSKRLENVFVGIQSLRPTAFTSSCYLLLQSAFLYRFPAV